MRTLRQNKRKYVEYYVAIAQNHRQVYEALGLEFDQIRGCVNWLSHQPDARSARQLLDLISAMSGYMRTRSLYSELLNWSEYGLLACERIQMNKAWLLRLRFHAYYALGDWDRAENTILAAAQTVQDSNLKDYAETLLILGTFRLNRGNYSNALKILSEAEAKFVSCDDRTNVANVKSQVAAFYLNRGDLQKARQLYHEVYDLRRSVNQEHPPGKGHSLLMLGVVYRKLGDFERATQYLQELRQIGEDEQIIATIATATHHLAWVAIDQGDLITAKNVGEKVRHLYQQIKDIRGLADVDEQLGLIALKMDQLNTAHDYLCRSLSIRRDLGNQHGVASTLRRLAIVHFKQGNYFRCVTVGIKSLWLYLRLNMIGFQRLTKAINRVLH